jgi:hypothetical protein
MISENMVKFAKVAFLFFDFLHLGLGVVANKTKAKNQKLHIQPCCGEKKIFWYHHQI